MCVCVHVRVHACMCDLGFFSPHSFPFLHLSLMVLPEAQWTESATWWSSVSQLSLQTGHSLVLTNQKKIVTENVFSKELTLVCPKICFSHVVSCQVKSLNDITMLETVSYPHKIKIHFKSNPEVPELKTLVIIPSDWNAKAENAEYV